MSVRETARLAVCSYCGETTDDLCGYCLKPCCIHCVCACGSGRQNSREPHTAQPYRSIRPGWFQSVRAFALTILVCFASWALMVPTTLWAQAPPPTTVQAQNFQVNPAAPLNQVKGATVTAAKPGTATYFYWIVSDNSPTYSQPAGPFAVVNAPNTLSASANDTITWQPVAGVNFYDVLRTTSTAVPTGACACAVSIGVANTTIVDSSNSLSAYTVNAMGSPWTVLSKIDAGIQQLEKCYQGLCSALSASSLTEAQGAISFLPSCGSSQPDCYTIGNGFFTENATYTASSPIVTVPASGSNFHCAGAVYPCASGGDVGDVAFAEGNCAGNVVVCSEGCPQTTIASIQSATQATLATNCTASSSVTAHANNFFWGPDNGATFQTGFAAAFPAQSTTAKSVQIACGVYLTTLNPFIIPGTATYYTGATITGCSGGGVSIIVPTPNMNCNNGGGHGCLFSDPIPHVFSIGENTPGWKLRDLFFWGGGSTAKGTSAIYSNPAIGIYLNATDEADNVYVIGWVSGQANTVGVWNFSSTMIQSGSFGGGFTGCEFSTISIPAQMTGGQCGGGNGGPSIMASSSNQAAIHTDGVYFNQNFGVNGLGVSVIGSAVWYSNGDNITYSAQVAGGTAYFTGTVLNQFSGGNSALTISSGKAVLADSLLHGGGKLINQTGGTIIDACGNFLDNSIALTITNLYGSCSVTGTAQTAGNITPSTVWGTTGAAGNGVSAVTGSTLAETFTITAAGTPAANPTVAIVFPVAFWAAPSGGCSAQQIGGTGIISDAVVSTPTATGVTFTWQGTPVAASTYIFRVSCQNP